jgi:lysozyme
MEETMPIIDHDRLAADLVRDEDRRKKPYDDATGEELRPGDTLAGKLTVGVGWNLTDNPLPDRLIDLLLDESISRAFRDLDHNVSWWRAMPEPAQRALANMCFNLGWPRLAGFRNMLAALRAGDYKRAAVEALDSTWARQVGERAVRVADLYRSGGVGE